MTDTDWAMFLHGLGIVWIYLAMYPGGFSEKPHGVGWFPRSLLFAVGMAAVVASRAVLEAP